MWVTQPQVAALSVLFCCCFCELQWPASGEIGIADHRDTSTSISHGIQLREYGQHAWRVSETPLADTSLDWHVYKLEWNCDYLRW
jgi:beta-glucanase (GH16 family)